MRNLIVQRVQLIAVIATTALAFSACGPKDKKPRSKQARTGSTTHSTTGGPNAGKPAGAPNGAAPNNNGTNNANNNGTNAGDKKGAQTTGDNKDATGTAGANNKGSTSTRGRPGATDPKPNYCRTTDLPQDLERMQKEKQDIYPLCKSVTVKVGSDGAIDLGGRNMREDLGALNLYHYTNQGESGATARYYADVVSKNNRIGEQTLYLAYKFMHEVAEVKMDSIKITRTLNGETKILSKEEHKYELIKDQNGGLLLQFSDPEVLTNSIDFKITINYELNQ